MSEKMYSIKRNLLKQNADYNMIIGERSNGKSFSVHLYALELYVKFGYQLAIIRRWDTDFMSSRGKKTLTHLVTNYDNVNYVKKLTDNKWDNIVYSCGAWYLCKYDDILERRVMDETPFAFSFALNVSEHDKSNSDTMNIRTILFDEFLTRGRYLNDEYIIFMNTISTIVRLEDNIKIFMCGNTVNPYSPYFEEFGIDDITTLNKGDIKIIESEKNGLKVKLAIEFSDSVKGGKKSDRLFAFKNAKLDMIREGAWEMNMYPHLPTKYKPNEVVLKFYIKFNIKLLECDVVSKDNGEFCFIYIHNKTTPLKNEETDIVFANEFSMRPTWVRNILKPQSDWHRQILWFFNNDKVCYQTNMIGEVVRNYFMWCRSESQLV